MEYAMSRNIESRTGSLRRLHANASACQVPVLIATFVFALTLIAALGPSPSFADQQTESGFAGMQSGTVTEVREHTVAIDGREYGFSPKIVVLDHEGKETELAYITTKSKVHFRVVKDEAQKIERIIVYHPE